MQKLKMSQKCFKEAVKLKLPNGQVTEPSVNVTEPSVNVTEPSVNAETENEPKMFHRSSIVKITKWPSYRTFCKCYRTFCKCRN